MTAGFYSLTNLVIAFAGTISTSPLGPLAVPSELSVDVNRAENSAYALQISSREGDEIGEFVSKTPLKINHSELPGFFIDAVIAAEDERFLQHDGVDPAGIAGALRDIARGRLRGGSTITQQMVKNTLIGNDQTIGRKVLEAMIAARIDAELDKTRIIEKYLESAWYGRGLTGVARAPMVWFGKDWDEISLAEAATLAAMLKGPSLFDPWKNPEKTEARRNAILNIMHQQGWIQEDQYQQARAETVVALPPEQTLEANRWIVSAVEDDLSKRSGLPADGSAGLTIRSDWQELATAVVQDKIRQISPVQKPVRVPSERMDALRELEKPELPSDLRVGLPFGTPYNSALLMEHDDAGWDLLIAGRGMVRDISLENPYKHYSPEVGDLVAVEEISANSEYQLHVDTEIQAALVAMDPRTGEILATVGGVDAGLTEFDRTRASRQPGSSIKPFLYLAALKSGFSADSPVDDIEHTWTTRHGVAWRPRNYDHSQSGRIAMYSALERSSNLAAAYLVNRIGVDAMAEVAEAAGAYPAGGMNRHISSSLGASEVRLRDLVAGYAAIVNNGWARTPHVVRAIKDEDGTELPEDYRKPGPIAGRENIRDILGMMRGVVVRGTSSVAFKANPVAVAGKTGTTQNWRDAWFVGVTPHIAIGVWIGRDDNKPLPNHLAGGTAAAPVVAEIFRKAFEAGMIDENGLLDEEEPAMSWPPELHKGSAARAPVVAAAPSTASAVKPAATSKPKKNVLISAPAQSGISGFWGGAATKQPVQAATPSPVNVNRNADILELIR
jgi:penicillin-binding protein 1A